MSSSLYKEKVIRWHNAKILCREIRVDDLVLLYNSPFKSFWKSLCPSGLAHSRLCKFFIAIKLESKDGTRFKVNGQHIKLYFGNELEVQLIEVVYLDDA